MIKFFFKIVIVLIVAMSAVIYHNTESGRDMERKIGEEIKLDNLAERSKEFLKEAIYFLSLKGLEYKKENDGKGKSVSGNDTLSGNENVKKSAHEERYDQKASSAVEKKDKKEHIEDKDRRMLEQIIEGEN